MKALQQPHESAGSGADDQNNQEDSKHTAYLAYEIPVRKIRDFAQCPVDVQHRR